MFGFFRPALHEQAPHSSRSRRWSSIALAASTMFFVAAAVPATGVAQGLGDKGLTEKQMIEQLLGKTSRSATPAAGQPAQPAARTLTPAETARLRDLLDKAGTRAFTAKERIEVAEVTRERPSLDFEIYFPFNSSSLQKTAMETMQRIGQLLTNDAFKDRAFLIAGHTDAKGKPEPNRIVSQRRAESVKAYLVKSYGIDPNRLRVIGYGKEQLKDNAQPFSSINRRVQIINLPDGTLTASR